MARDYKHAGSRRRGIPASAFNGWTGLGLGLSIGLALAVGVHLYHTDEGRDEPADEPAQAESGPPQRTQGPRFDFYRMLPNYEVVLPEEDIPVSPAPEFESLQPTGNYVLQAGSFRNAGDADRLRAELALLGVESRVQTVTIDDTDTWHRVRIGPIRDLAVLDETRGKLAQNEMDVLVIRVGD